MSKTDISIVWFRQDLRLTDNPALSAAARLGPVLPIYVYDDPAAEKYKLGSATKLWLHESLNKLNDSLGDKLNVYNDDIVAVIERLVSQHNVSKVLWNCCYEPWLSKQEQKLKNRLKQLEVEFQDFNGSYLWTPEEVVKDDGTFYRVFTPFKNRAYTVAPRVTEPRLSKLSVVKDKKNNTSIASLDLVSEHPWTDKLLSKWQVGEQAAKRKLKNFVADKISNYKKGRDFPSLGHTSRLSPHLHFGELSPKQVWDEVQSNGRGNAPKLDVDHFLSELIWREFSCYLLYHFDKLHVDNFNSKFDAFPWQTNSKLLKAWQRGQTGYPIVDAGMRELWQTGYMHNRIRMVVASFLVKNLMLHWHKGRDWFWDCLFDADLANNSASWQWVAGCGADAAPYFRIFNPITQGEKFDPQGLYTRKFVPELAKLPDKYLYRPWEAPEQILQQAGVELGKNYPKPIIDLKASRNAALEAYKTL